MRSSTCRLGRAAPYVTALLIAAMVCPSLFLGLPPHTHDHNFHLANAVETQRLLRAGRLVGWSDFQLGGHLANGFYPPGVSAAIAALHWVARGALSWDAAYSIVFLAFLATFAIGFFLLARELVGTWAALAGAMVALLWDRGGLFNGGWYFYVDLGVWPFGFSVAFTLAALALLPRAFSQGGVGRICAIAALCALAVLTHPFALLSLPLLAALQLTVWGAMGCISTRAIGRAVAAVGLGFALSAWWWVPFALRSSQMEHYAVPPVSVAQYARELAMGSGGDLISWWVLPAALVGTWLAWRRREPWGRWFAIAGWSLLLASTELPYLPLGDAARRGWLASLQLVRLQTLSRLLLIALAIQAAFSALRYLRGRLRSVPRRALAAAAAGACSFIALGLLGARGHLKIPRGGAPHRPTCYSREQEAELRSLLERLKPSLAGGRLAVDNHCLVLAASLVESPFFKIGQTPANEFGGKFSTEDPRLLARLGVAVVLSDGLRTGPLSELPLLQRVGRFEARGLTPLPRVEAGDGAARVDVRLWSDEEIRLTVDATRDTDLRLWVNFYPDWEAWQGDVRLPIHRSWVGPARLIRIRAGPGEVRLHFGVLPSTRVCQGLSLVAMAAMLVVLGREFLRKRGLLRLATTDG